MDSISGRIACSHQVGGWENFDLRGWLIEQTKLPVSLENDSNAAALAEAILGAGRGADPVFYFNLGSGVGGGLVAGGAIYHGAPPGEAEFGHLRLDRSGATVESRCSGWAIDRRLRDLAHRRPDSPLEGLLASEMGSEARHLAAAIRLGDAGASALLHELADDLGFALSHVVHLLHPQVIVMGGGLALVGEPLREAIAAVLPKYVMQAFAPGPSVQLARLDEDAVPVGALLLVATDSARPPPYPPPDYRGRE